MRQVVGFGDRSTERGNFGANMGRPTATNGDFAGRHGPVSKLLWADLLLTSASLSSLLLLSSSSSSWRARRYEQWYCNVRCVFDV